MRVGSHLGASLWGIGPRKLLGFPHEMQMAYNQRLCLLTDWH